MHADSPSLSITKYTRRLSTKKIHLKCDVFNGSVVNGLRQPHLYSFVLDEPPRYK